MTKSILETVHQTAKGLHDADLLDVKTMREFDALCLPPIKKYTARQIKQIRIRNRASQGVFAAYMNMSESAIQKWERGEKKPNGPSLKLLNLIDVNGTEALG